MQCGKIIFFLFVCGGVAFNSPADIDLKGCYLEMKLLRRTANDLVSPLTLLKKVNLLYQHLSFKDIKPSSSKRLFADSLVWHQLLQCKFYIEPFLILLSKF